MKITRYLIGIDKISEEELKKFIEILNENLIKYNMNKSYLSKYIEDIKFEYPNKFILNIPKCDKETKYNNQIFRQLIDMTVKEYNPMNFKKEVDSSAWIRKEQPLIKKYKQFNFDKYLSDSKIYSFEELHKRIMKGIYF